MSALGVKKSRIPLSIYFTSELPRDYNIQILFSRVFLSVIVFRYYIFYTNPIKKVHYGFRAVK